MEDFGLHTCGQLLEAGADRAPFDQAAAGILARLHQAFKPSMLGATKTPLFNAALFTDQATLFLDHYFPQVFRRAPTAMERSGFVEAWHTVLSPLDALPRTLLLRDFMPDNAIKLTSLSFGFPIGILDFQDAGLGPVAYDLGSWCENCRREGGMERLNSFIGLYCALNPEVDSQTLFVAARVFLAQRYTRFLGILVRQKRMVDTSRVWNALKLLLKDEQLAPVRRWFASIAPSP
jgi:aminoglycoside/choline kinase family phosphotransferase